MTKQIHLIGGPTASGKTALALALARQAPSVIINADAMQVYRSVPILTAQPTEEEMAQASHKLFAFLDPSEKCSAGKWLEQAQKIIQEALAADKTPIVVGGTGLYFHVLLNGIANVPDIPDEVRQEIAALYDEIGHDAFREKLHTLDPESAARIEANDRQRLIRAYEVVAHTGRTLGEWQTAPSTPPLPSSLRRQGSPLVTEGEEIDITPHLILPDRSDLYARCDSRFLQMMECGALEEVRDLLALNLSPDLPAMKILGIPHLAAHLRGEIPLDLAIAKAQQATRNYAKRQMTWFRNRWKKMG
jgi:tRNA dimethylallyltransferase